MRSTHLFVLGLLVLASAAFAAQNVTIEPLNAPYKSSPTMNTSPDTAFGFTQYNANAGRYDRNADGRVDLIVADRNGDGRGDYWATDRNFDGMIDDYQYDRNFDGRIDQWEYDLNYDGVSDKIYVDANGDGRPDMYAGLNPGSQTYTWYGNLSGVQAAGGLSKKAQRRLASGQAANSY
ncbi:MAG TPA: hypothetical protein PKM25_01040 [Candidatus Ozemobacteraceae bacterium]|nr:hypothetical protein [Candidatus Ozemobacteraceae bacterium]